MKKRLFLIPLIAVLFVCVFAITANADLIALDEDPGLDCDASLVSTLDIDAYNNSTASDKESRIVLTDGTKFYVFPSFYVVSSSSSNYSYSNFSILQNALEGQVTFSSYKESLIRIQIPTYITTIHHGVAKFENYSNLKEVRFGTHLTNIHAQNAFSNCSSLEFISDISHMVQINNAGFNGCPNLNIHINWPAAVTSINTQMFSGTGITSITIPEGVTSIGQTSFNNCDNLTEVILPNTVTSVGKMAFSNCAKLETVNFGAGFTTFSSPNNDYETFLYTSSIKYIYVPSTFANKLTGSKGFYNIFNQGKNVTFFFTGTYEEAQAAQNKFIAATANSNVANAELVAYDSTIDYTTYAESLGKCIIVYDYNKCKAFYNDIHNYENENAIVNDCAKICGVCSAVEQLDEQKHNLTTEISYEKLTEPGVKHIYCSNTGCIKNETLEAPVLFEFVGYSTNQENTELCVGYSINVKAIEEYNLCNETDILYGVVATVIDEGENLTLSYENGTVSSNLSNTVLAPINGLYSGFDFKLTGFKDFEEGDKVDLKSLNLVMSAYAYNGEFYFIGSADNLTYYEREASTVTFAQIQNKTN